MALDGVVTFAAVIAVPIALGGLLGAALRRVRGRRFRGIVAAAAFLVVPPVMLTRVVFWFPFIGLWDALLEGLLVGAGIAWTAHRALAGRVEVGLAAASLLASLLGLELACRVFLPVPPGFPTAGGPHFLLADAMHAGSQGFSWDLRSKEIVCSVIYEAQYPGILDVRDEREIVVPRQFTPRSGATRRVLHIGDSMTFGFGVARTKTFTADLEHLEAGPQHINGSVPGVAPDAYYLLLRRWVALHDIDLAVMYVFEGNDLAGLDDHYPCCHWQSLLTYGPEGVGLRCPTAAPIDLREAGTTWLRYNSPPPYLVRALVDYSSAAAHVSAAIVSTMPNNPLAVHQSVETQLQHLEFILRAARDELRARRIPFVVVVLPNRTWVERRTTDHLTPAIMQAAQRLGVPALDAWEALSDEVGRGQQIFLDPPGDPHYNAIGHALIATWLHERLAGVADPSQMP